jgi:hypothetical protein
MRPTNGSLLDILENTALHRRAARTHQQQRSDTEHLDSRRSMAERLVHTLLAVNLNFDTPHQIDKMVLDHIFE